MNKLVSVGFKVAASVVNLLRGATIAAFPILPNMKNLIKVDITVSIVKVRKAVFAAGILRAIEAAATHQGCQACNGDAVKLMVHDVVDALLKVWNLIGQSFNQSFGNLS